MVAGPLLTDGAPPRGRMVRRVVIAVVAGALAGAAVLLQVRGWLAVSAESGGSCGRFTECPRGTTPVLVGSIVVVLAALPVAVRFLFGRPRFLALVTAVAAAAGALAGQQVFTWLHGGDLAVDWSAPYDASDTLKSEGAWTDGPAVIRARLDEVVGYAGATGHADWAYHVPGQDVICTMSAGTAEHVGLIGYATAGGPCADLVAIDLTSGHQLWSVTVDGAQTGPAPDLVAVDGGIAAVVTPGAVVGYDVRTGARRWSTPTPAGCSTTQVAADGGQVAGIAECDSGYDVVALTAASGARRWDTTVTERDPHYEVGIVAANPVVVNDMATTGRKTDTERVFGATGQVSATVTASDVDTPDGPVVLDTDRHVFDAAPVWWTFVDHGLLVGVTKPAGGHSDAVAFGLSDGRRRWLAPLPAGVLAARDDAGRLLVVADARPSPVLESVSVRDGSTAVVGVVPAGVFGDETAIYPSGPGFALVNSTGTDPVAPVSVIGR